MKRFYPVFLAILFFPFCSSRKTSSEQIYISGGEIALSVQLDVLKFACERRLYALETDTQPAQNKPRQAQKIEAMSASEPVYQK